MESRIAKIYIPRILGSVNKSIINGTFDNLKIGKVFYIDIHNRVNENKNPYYFAFVMIQLYNTIEANTFYGSICENKVVRIFYDIEEAKFWEVKKHVELKDRGHLSCNVKQIVTKAPAFMTLKWFVDKYNKQPESKHNFGKIHPILDKSIFSKTKEFIPYGIDIESGLTEQDRIELINEYYEIEKEIYNGIPFLGRIEIC
jgi:hypothetical protein|uniref:Uncharacterized protein n=1 Tax=viral metagenome TaxID=1070528 RepID=A0A6C0DNP2_9ZZZZ